MGGGVSCSVDIGIMCPVPTNQPLVGVVMGCNCKGTISSNRGGLQSWNDFLTTNPVDPLDVLAYATLNNTAGTWALTNNYATPTPPSVWGTSPIAITGDVATSSNNSTTAQSVFDATSYDFSHTSVNTSTTLAPPLRKIVFMRAGVMWTNLLPLTITGSPNVVEVQLSLLDNAATRGDAQGTYPVIRWPSPGPYVGAMNLELVFRAPGRYALGIVTIDNNSTPGWSMFALDAVVI